MTVVAAMDRCFIRCRLQWESSLPLDPMGEKETSLEDSTRNVEVFDTAIAIMAGLMIIPAVFAFSGGDPDLCRRTALMFITIPKSV